MTTDIKTMANALRALSMDAVQAANSGHPGMPLGMADVASVLYSKFLKFNPKKPNWQDRDRFILSAGHGSMLLYALNYLTGYEKITLDAIKNFRQLDSICDGHPEHNIDAGIEMTTGPLGQGLASAVGMALAEKRLAKEFGDELVDHHTYVIAGDGCLMEGISHEACSMAGHWGLSKLIVLYDDNGISIDGSTDLSFTEDVPKRFEAYGWNAQRVDGHNPDEVEAAIKLAKQSDKPSIICCKTTIGFGSPAKAGTSGAHGSPLGAEEIKLTKAALGWNYGAFEIPEDVLSEWREIGKQNDEKYELWAKKYKSSKLQDRLQGDVSIEGAIKGAKENFENDSPKMATRACSGKTLEALLPKCPQLIGGSADLTGSVNTLVKGFEDRHIHYGVREFAMAAAMNGLALHGGFIPYAGTFLVFSDYCRPAIRLSALMKQRVIYVMTHDSIGLGEDGPTHQPVEHLASFRAMPNLNVFRPCDGIETAECWEIAITNTSTPSVMVLSRQGLPTVRNADKENICAKGAYILKENSQTPDVTLFASGSEVSIALDAYGKLVSEGATVRIVSVPCMELFWRQDKEYIQNIICNKSVKVAIEAGVKQGWGRFVGQHGTFIGMDSFGASAPASELYEHFGITAKNVVEAALSRLSSK